MTLPELFAAPASVGSTAWVLAHLAAAITTTPAAGTVEQYAVDAAAPAALRAANGRFRVAIDGEEMIVLASASGASPWYFIRGVNGTVQAHANAAPIYHIPTPGSMRSSRRPSELRSKLSADVQRAFFTPGPTDNPAITVGAGNAASVITGAAALAGYTQIPNDPRFRILGSPGPLVQAGTVWPDTLKYLANGGAASKAIGNLLSYGMAFDVYCSRIEIAVFGNGQFVNIYVNGVKQTVPQIANDGAQHNILLDWTGTTGLGLRRIRVENAAGQKMLGFYLAATEDIMAPDINQSGLRMMVLGDSWNDGTGTVDGISGYGVLAGKMLGIDDVWQAGIGGTGYLNDSTQGSHLAPRIATDIVPNNPDIVFLAYGSDDTAYTTAQVATEATADWEAIMGALPDSLLVVLGPYACPASGGSPNYTGGAPYNTALKNAAASLGVRFIDSIAEKWITGTGYVGATNGSGTSDTLIGTDGIHPSQAGHNFMARRVANKLAQILWTL